MNAKMEDASQWIKIGIHILMVAFQDTQKTRKWKCNIILA